MLSEGLCTILFSADPRRYVVISFFSLFFSMQVFGIGNGKSWIGVLVVAVALGGSSSCQKRQSTPKNEPQRSTKTPNGEEKQDGSSGSDGAYKGAANTSAVQKPDQHDSGTMSNGSSRKVIISPRVSFDLSGENESSPFRRLEHFVSVGDGRPNIVP